MAFILFYLPHPDAESHPFNLPFFSPSIPKARNLSLSLPITADHGSHRYPCLSTSLVYRPKLIRHMINVHSRGISEIHTRSPDDHGPAMDKHVSTWNPQRGNQERFVPLVGSSSLPHGPHPPHRLALSNALYHAVSTL